MKRQRHTRILWSFANGVRYPHYPVTIAEALERFNGTNLGPRDEALLQRHDPEKGWVTVQRRVGHSAAVA